MTSECLGVIEDYQGEYSKPLIQIHHGGPYVIMLMHDFFEWLTIETFDSVAHEYE